MYHTVHPFKLCNSIAFNRGGSVDEASDFGSGHDLMVHGFELHIRLCADRDRKSTRLNSSHIQKSRMPSSA